MGKRDWGDGASAEGACSGSGNDDMGGGTFCTLNGVRRIEPVGNDQVANGKNGNKESVPPSRTATDPESCGGLLREAKVFQT